MSPAIMHAGTWSVERNRPARMRNKASFDLHPSDIICCSAGTIGSGVRSQGVETITRGESCGIQSRHRYWSQDSWPRRPRAPSHRPVTDSFVLRAWQVWRNAIIRPWRNASRREAPVRQTSVWTGHSWAEPSARARLRPQRASRLPPTTSGRPRHLRSSTRAIEVMRKVPMHACTGSFLI
jgi:hypothetical protein